MCVNCLIVDDEPIARDIILHYCSHFPRLSVKGTAANAFEAREILAVEKIDILFLDINMPALDGIAFLKTLQCAPQVILTTAYKEYGVEAFDLAVCDYLLKPFSLHRFMVAVDKATERIGDNTVKKTDMLRHSFIKADGKIYNLHFNDLLFAEACGNYTKLITQHSTIMPAASFSSIENILPTDMFLRVHRSFIINKFKIDHISGNRIIIQKHEIPVGSNFKSEFLLALGL